VPPFDRKIQIIDYPVKEDINSYKIMIKHPHNIFRSITHLSVKYFKFINKKYQRGIELIPYPGAIISKYKGITTEFPCTYLNSVTKFLVFHKHIKSDVIVLPDHENDMNFRLSFRYIHQINTYLVRCRFDYYMQIIIRRRNNVNCPKKDFLTKLLNIPIELYSGKNLARMSLYYV
jgi:hypothetical protein